MIGCKGQPPKYNHDGEKSMKKILIAFLGNAQYQETIYQIEDKQYKDQLAFIPIYKHFSPVETAYVIGTKESRWELLENFPHKRIEIPYGRSESDFWEMFDILTRDMNIAHLRCEPVGVRFIEPAMSGVINAAPTKYLKRKFLYY